MSLLSRRPIRIGRAQRGYRDDRFFVVATEDTYAPKQYLNGLSLKRVKVLVLETPEGSGLSAPEHVVERLCEYRLRAGQCGEFQDDDEFWVLMDTDHHIERNHKAQFVRALKSAVESGFRVAVSNPCFEVWLLLHYVDLGDAADFSNAASVERRLVEIIGGYNKRDIEPSRFPPTRVQGAIRRARALEEIPDDPKGYWPEGTGTRVYRLMEALGFGVEPRSA